LDLSFATLILLENVGEMTNQFKPGDVVVLKSGGPKMTVDKVGLNMHKTPRVWCEWFEGSAKHTGNFTPESLKHSD
jgi:uncharacterized protein YodC (DUF2158 family)